MKALLDVEQKEVSIALEEAKQSRPPPPGFDGAGDVVDQLAARLAANPLLARRLGGVLSAAKPPADEPPESA